MKNKKGISPLIATVILVSIVIIIAILLWFWYNQFLAENRDKAQIQLNQECVQNTEIRVRDIECTDQTDNYLIEFEIENPGTSKITKILFNVKSQSDSVTNEVGKPINPGTSVSMALNVSKSDLGNENIEEIEIIPGISSGQVLKYCEEQSQFVQVTCI